jgi:hypothetical protein
LSIVKTVLNNLWTHIGHEEGALTMVVSHIQAPAPQDVEDVLRALNERRIQQGCVPGAAEQTDQNRPLDFGRDAYLASDPAIERNEEISTEKNREQQAIARKARAWSHYWQRDYRYRRDFRMAALQ